MLEFGTESNKKGYALLDHRWQSKLGDFTFDAKRFPEPKNILAQMLRKGLRMILTITPFISTESPNFAIASNLGLFVKQKRDHGEKASGLTTPALTTFKVREVFIIILKEITLKYNRLLSLYAISSLSKNVGKGGTC